MDEQIKVKFVGDASSLNAAADQSAKSLDNVSKATAQVSQSLASASSSMAQNAAKLGGSLDHVANRSSTARFAVQNLSNVIRDVPFGINNPAIFSTALDHVVASMTMLKQEAAAMNAATGGSQTAFGLLKQSLAGGGGLLLAFNAVTLAATLLAPTIAKITSNMFGLASESEITKETISDIFTDAAKSAGGQVAKLEVFRQKLNDVNLSSSDRVRVAKEYNEIADKQNQIDLTQIGNLEQINQKLDAQNKLIVQRAVSTAATSKLGDFANKFVEADLKVQEGLKASGQTEDQYLQKNQKFITALTNAYKAAKGPLSSAQADMLNQMGRNLQKNDLSNLFFDRNAAKEALDKAVQNLSSLITVPGLTTKGVGDKTSKSKTSFLFDFLPFNPNGTLKAEDKNTLLEAIDKFQKEFGAIFQGAVFTGTEDQRITQAKTFDLELKAGKVKFNTDSLREAFNKLNKDSDIIPKDALEALPQLVVDQFIRGFQNESERIKGINLFGDLLHLDSPDSLLADFQLQLKRVGGQIPKMIEATDVFGNKIQLPFDKLFDTSQVNVEGIKNALKKAFGEIVDVKDQFQKSFEDAFKNFKVDAFASVGQGIADAITGGGFDNAIKAIGDVFGSFLQELGKLLIKEAVAAEVFKKAFAALLANPVAAIAAGVGLIALGGILKNVAMPKPKKFSTGGFVPGIGNSDIFPALLTPGEYVIPKNQVGRFLDKNAGYATGPSVQEVPYIASLDVSHDKMRLLLKRANYYGNIFGK